jgi:hypothetical protein
VSEAIQGDKTPDKDNNGSNDNNDDDGGRNTDMLSEAQQLLHQS